MFRCKICDNEKDNPVHIAREMMFGYRDTFEYFECSRCGCLQIATVPSNLSRYYPSSYYSFEPRKYSKQSIVNSILRSQLTKYWLDGKNVIGMLMARRRKKEAPYFVDWFKDRNISLNSKILDVGSGSGKLLVDMRQYGFRGITGVDPYLKEDIFYDKGVTVLKKNVYELTQVYDFILLKDSFEHILDPLSVLNQLHRLLKPKGCLLIMMPVAGCYAWKKYNVNWVQLDAPRHIFLHTIKSFGLLAHKAEFQINDIKYDSYDFQFWGSEQYIKDIPLFDPRSRMVNPESSLFSKAQIEEFKTRSHELNENGLGDQARFYLHKK